MPIGTHVPPVLELSVPLDKALIRSNISSCASARPRSYWLMLRLGMGTNRSRIALLRRSASISCMLCPRFSPAHRAEYTLYYQTQSPKVSRICSSTLRKPARSFADVFPSRSRKLFRLPASALNSF